MFFLHVLLFYLLGASVARSPHPVLSGGEARLLRQGALRVAFTNNDGLDMWYRLPPLQMSNEPMAHLNDVIGGSRHTPQIMLYNLQDRPGVTHTVDFIHPEVLLQRLEGAWRLMPDASNFDRRFEELIVHNGQIQVIRHLRREPEIESRPQTPPPQDRAQTRPRTPVSQGSTPPSHGVDHDEEHGFSQRMVGFWYRVKGVHSNDVVHLRSDGNRIFYGLSGNPGEMNVIQVAPHQVPNRLLGLWLRMPQASTIAQHRRDELAIWMEHGELVFDITAFL